MTAKDWQENIDAVVKARMTEAGFLFIDHNFKYVKKLNEVVDFVVQLKQNRRWSVVGEIELAPTVGIVQREIAELAIALMGTKEVSHLDYAFHSNDLFWVFYNVLTPHLDRRPWTLTPNSNQETIEFVVDEVVAAVSVKVEEFQQQFDSMEAILEDMLALGVIRARMWKTYYIPVTHILCGRYDEALLYVENLYQDFVAKDRLKYNKTYVVFRTNVQAEIARRRAEGEKV